MTPDLSDIEKRMQWAVLCVDLRQMLEQRNERIKDLEYALKRARIELERLGFKTTDGGTLALINRTMGECGAEKDRDVGAARTLLACLANTEPPR